MIRRYQYHLIIIAELIESVFRLWIVGDIIEYKNLGIYLKLLKASKQKPSLAPTKVEYSDYPDYNHVITVTHQQNLFV